MSERKIQARILKGFRDYPPLAASARNDLLDALRRVFSSFGYAAIDTPALEYSEILLGKGSEEADGQLFRFEDQGGRDVALRFDLTVPLARFCAMHLPNLGQPFRRFHIGPVWRAEKPQRGRFREFLQCDFDIIGASSALADAEILSIAATAFSALGTPCTIRLNSRMLLDGLFEALDAREKKAEALRAMDKLHKAGREVVSAELKRGAEFSERQIETLFSFLALTEKAEKRSHSENLRKNEEALEAAQAFVGSTPSGTRGLSELRAILSLLSQGLGEKQNFVLDFSIARGLDYYTGMVFETTLDELPSIGSVCSGGRYENLLAVYSKTQTSGVGASVGLDRLLAGLEELGQLASKQSPASVLITLLDEESAGFSLGLSTELRSAGIDTELYPQATKLGVQLKYANRRGIPLVVLLGSKERENGCCSIRRMGDGYQQDDVAFEMLLDCVNTLSK